MLVQDTKPRNRRRVLFSWLMAKIIEDLDDFVTYVNTLYNTSSTAPSSTEEDYLVWQNIANIAVSVWENEEGIFWNELFVKLADAATGDKTTSAGDYSYAVPDDFRFPASGLVWLGTNTNKIAYKVIKQEQVQLLENDLGYWCYFLQDGSPTLEFNRNLTINGGETISYNYYKHATKLTTGSSVLEMSDPMFAVYFTLAELRKEEGNSMELQMASQKLEGMKTRNTTPTWMQNDSFLTNADDGFGY